MATKLTTLPDFIVTIDAAGHLVVDRCSEVGTIIKTIDFGAAGCDVAGLVCTWLYLDDVSRDALDPAINAYLLEQFAQRA